MTATNSDLRAEVRIAGVTLAASIGQQLIELCDQHPTALRFCCRAGSCGTCAVRVLEGASNLSELTDNERIVLDDAGSDSTLRLACQIRVLGPAILLPAEETS